MAADRRRTARPHGAALSLLVLGVLSLSAAAWLAAGPAVTAAGSVVDAPPPTQGPSDPASSGAERPARANDTAPPPAPVSPEPVAAPSVVEVPAIALRSELIELGLDEHRRLEVPADPDLAGWWTGGPRPGEQGAAVIAGHVDSIEGPAVFWRLHELGPGDRVTVHDVQGASTDFVVDRVERWPKDDFPTDEVYLGTDGRELRLITCGGGFDARARSYEDNLVVFATAEPR
jgi:sortase (surface protein transpeptidase)